jgi:hypothetical protein
MSCEEFDACSDLREQLQFDLEDSRLYRFAREIDDLPDELIKHVYAACHAFQDFNAVWREYRRLSGGYYKPSNVEELLEDTIRACHNRWPVQSSGGCSSRSSADCGHKR